MRLLTNPGSNLPEHVVRELGIELVPQRILVDGVEHDTRGDIDFAQVDAWVREAKRHPTVLGTHQDDFVAAFERLAKEDPQLVAVMTSRKIIGSHDAAVRGLAEARRRGASSLQVEIVDSGVTDVGAGLCTLVAAQARALGLDPLKTAMVVRRFAQRQLSLFGIPHLDHLLRGGRANFLQTWLANVFRVRPLVGFLDGQLSSMGRVSSNADLALHLADAVTAKVGRGARVWVGVSHANAPDQGARLVAFLQERLTCELVLLRPLSASIYLHGGPGALLAFVFPSGGLPIDLHEPRFAWK